MKTLLQLKILVLAPPAGVTFAVQRGRFDLLAPILSSPDSQLFEFSVVVADIASQPPRLTGEFVQGPSAGRFVYVNSGSYAGKGVSKWSRRAKVGLGGISADLVRTALDLDAPLQATIQGTGKDGGPACATVPFVSDWAVVPGT